MILSTALLTSLEDLEIERVIRLLRLTECCVEFPYMEMVWACLCKRQDDDGPITVQHSAAYECQRKKNVKQKY